jgi:Helix-turn-helix
MSGTEPLTHASWASPLGQRTLRGSGGRRPIDVLVGRRLLSRRLELGLSQDDLAAAVDVPTSRIAAYERGAKRILRWTPSVGQESARLKRESLRFPWPLPIRGVCAPVSIDLLILQSIPFLADVVPVYMWATRERSVA